MDDQNKRGGQTIHHDKDGNEYVVDADGKRQVPMQATPVRSASGFNHYDSANGHCGLCGRLTCNGGCLK